MALVRPRRLRDSERSQNERRESILAQALQKIEGEERGGGLSHAHSGPHHGARGAYDVPDDHVLIRPWGEIHGAPLPENGDAPSASSIRSMARSESTTYTAKPPSVRSV